MVIRTQYSVTIPNLPSAGEGSEPASMLVRRMSVEQRWTFDDIRFAVPDADREGLKKYVRDLAGQLGEYLVEWNLAEEDGTPIPATAAGFLTLEEDMMTQVIAAWVEIVQGISAPLDETSTGGSSFPEASIPMESPSASPENSAAPAS